MTPEQLKEILEAHAKWVRGDGGKRADLRGANLGGAYLRGAYLRDADLRDADLRGANLRDADLGGADLGGADLRDADLGGANLGGAYLRDADLGGANLGGADLGGADLGGADLGGAKLGDADLGDAYLGYGRKVVGLIARLTRIEDPYEFFAWRTDKGDFVKAGCRFLTVPEFRNHIADTYPGTTKAAETHRILDFIQASFDAVPVVQQAEAA